ncbi:MAG: hypothetical protein GH155_07080 [Spirochaeta sp.]|nr:hypothetical protein [Spirochaeta sp.]
MIAGVRGVTPIVFPNLIRVQGINSRMSLPVQRAHFVYARFKHIKGVPSADGGVPVFKLRVLDNLLDRMLAVKGSLAIDADKIKVVNPDNIDAITQRLQSTFRESLLAVKPAFSGLFPETGLLIDMIA